MDMLLTGLMVETAINSLGAIYDLIAKYEATGIDVIPIREIKEIIASEGQKVIQDENSLVNSMKKDLKEKSNG